MENVKVTVYLSTYNQAPYIAQALDSGADYDYDVVLLRDGKKVELA